MNAVTCMAELLNLTGRDGEWEIKRRRHRHTKLHVPGGIPECLPEPECLFYRSVQGNE
jgi:hypothetical protein